MARFLNDAAYQAREDARQAAYAAERRRRAIRWAKVRAVATLVVPIFFTLLVVWWLTR